MTDSAVLNELRQYAFISAVLDGLDDEFALRLLWALSHPSLGGQLRILVGIRGLEDQQRLYDLWIKYQSDPGQWLRDHPGQKAPALAAKPGTSKHQRGLAVDLDWYPHYDNWALAAAVLKYYGLWQAVRNILGDVIEDWHFELDPDREPLEDLRARLFPAEMIPATTPEDEEDDMKPLLRILGPGAYDAQFVRFATGEVRHLGPGEMTAQVYQALETVTETDEAAYQRLVLASGTEWRR